MTVTAESETNLDYSIGGNAALMAQIISSRYPHIQVLLVGSIGPKSKQLLHPRIITHNSTRIARDQLHLILEYKQGEIYGDHVAPQSSRFIISHDLFSASSIIIDMYFNTVAQYRPDLIILSGLHLFSNQPQELYMEKVRLTKRHLTVLPNDVPIHLQLGDLNDHQFAKLMLNKIIPLVDSLSLNEQELSFLSHTGNGPHGDQFGTGGVDSRTIHVHKAVDMIYWLLSQFGPDEPGKTQADKRRLTRVHYHCLTYHILAVRGQDWSNVAASIAAGARLAGRQACGLSHMDANLMDLRIGANFLLDSHLNKHYKFDPTKPLDSWMRGDVLFLFTPALVCKHPTKTVGLGDAIASVGLVYSQFYRYGMQAGGTPPSPVHDS